MKSKTPDLNTGSTADIAFLLLIFFMVTTTFETDRGILRKLPEWQENPTPPDIKDRNLLKVWVNDHDQVMIEGHLVEFRQIRPLISEFLLNPFEKDELPEKSPALLGSLGNVAVTKGLISVQNSRGASYEAYLQVVNEIEAAGNALKNEFSYSAFGMAFKALEPAEQDLVRKARPCMISESEPGVKR